jgi:hypothetical protein
VHCWLVREVNATLMEARQACQAAGGDVVWYEQPVKQQMVEVSWGMGAVGSSSWDLPGQEGALS